MNDISTAEEGGVKKALGYLTTVLIPGETLAAWAVERRLFALLRRRSLIGATSGRFISITRGLFGGFDEHDVRWQDLKEVKLRVGIFGATLTLTVSAAADLASDATGGHLLQFSGLRKEQAQEVYRVCQAQEQAWREKRRVRDLEELRAKSGGIQMMGGMGQAPSVSDAAGASSESVRRLKEARQMLDEKLITDAEYEAIKARVINGA